MIDIIFEILDEIDSFRTETNEEKSKEIMENNMFLAEEYFGVFINSILKEKWKKGKEYLDVLEAMCKEEIESFMYDYSEDSKVKVK